MKIQVRTNPVFKDIELTLPYYCKGSSVKCHYWKVYSDEKCLHVTASETDYPSIEIYSSSLAFGDDRIEITKEEFDAEFAATLAVLTEKL